MLQWSPRHEYVSELTELLTRKGFCEDIGNLVRSRDMLDRNGFLDNMGTEVMETDAKIFSTRTGDVVRSKSDAAHIIFERATAYTGSRRMEGKTALF